MYSLQNSSGFLFLTKQKGGLISWKSLACMIELTPDQEIQRYRTFLARLKSDETAARQLLQKHDKELKVASSLLEDLSSIQKV